MTESSSLDKGGKTALDRIERSRRKLYVALAIVSVWEVILLATLFLVVNLHQNAPFLVVISRAGG